MVELRESVLEALRGRHGEIVAMEWLARYCEKGSGIVKRKDGKGFGATCLARAMGVSRQQSTEYLRNLKVKGFIKKVVVGEKQFVAIERRWIENGEGESGK